MKTNENNRVWKDIYTNLTWQVDVVGKWYTWDDIQKAADKLNSENYGGYSDWRVPTRLELKTLITEEGHENEASYTGKTYIKEPLLESVVRCPSASGFYWSSSEYISDDTDGWGVDFHEGYAGNYVKNNECYVRCVRGR